MEVENPNKKSRRKFFQLAIAGLTIAPLLLKSSNALAAGACPAMPPKGKAVGVPGEGMAKNLEYVLDAKTSKNAKYKAGSDCGNCKFFNSAKIESGHAPCTMMGMKYVTNCGWCKSYLLKA